ncbi:MAG: MFS transporter, partial [Chloroflexota bacterium]
AAKNYRRNFRLGIISGASFGFVDSIVSPYLVLSVFVNTLGAPNLLVGLLPAIANGGWYLPQFLISHRIQQLPRKQVIYRSAAVVRAICWISLIAATFLSAHNPVLLLTIFFALYTINNLAAGCAGTPFMDIVAKTIPVERRGSYFGGRDLWGALTALAAGYLVSLLLNPDIAPPFPTNFGLIFLFAGIAVFIGLGTFALVNEPAEASSIKSITFLEQVGAARHLVRANPIYRRFLLTRIVLAISDIATPFYAIYATRVLNIPPETIGVYIGISTLAGLLANPLWSRTSDRRGNRIVLLGAASFLLTLPLLALFFGFLPNNSTLAFPFGILFLLNGIARPAANIAYPSYLLEIAPAPERPLYISFTNTILGVATFVPVIGGALLDLFGFRALFVIALIVSLLAWWLARGMLEPRQLADRHFEQSEKSRST